MIDEEVTDERISFGVIVWFYGNEAMFFYEFIISFKVGGIFIEEGFMFFIGEGEDLVE